MHDLRCWYLQWIGKVLGYGSYHANWSCKQPQPCQQQVLTYKGTFVSTGFPLFGVDQIQDFFQTLNHAFSRLCFTTCQPLFASVNLHICHQNVHLNFFYFGIINFLRLFIKILDLLVVLWQFLQNSRPFPGTGVHFANSILFQVSRLVWEPYTFYVMYNILKCWFPVSEWQGQGMIQNWVITGSGSRIRTKERMVL